MLDTLIVALTFFLRFGVPALLLVGIGYMLGRYLGVRAPADIQAPMEAESLAPAEWARAVTVPPLVPCWVQQACDEARRADCPAFKRPEVPCWLAVQVAEGQLRDGCISCGMYHLEKNRRPVDLRVIKGRGATKERQASNQASL